MEAPAKDVVIFDLDGTLALIGHRHHFIENKKKKDWRGFFAACVHDLPNAPVISIFHALGEAGFERWIVSGRSDEVRAETEDWLKRHSIYAHRLVMRHFGDRSPDDSLKQKWLTDGTLPRQRIAMVFDDRDKVVGMWRRNGLTCLQVAPGDF